MVASQFLIIENNRPHALQIEEASLEVSPPGSETGSICVSATSDELPVPATLVVKHVPVNSNRATQLSVASVSPNIQLELFETHPLEDCEIKLEWHHDAWHFSFRGTISGALSSGSSRVIVDTPLVLN